MNWNPRKYFSNLFTRLPNNRPEREIAQDQAQKVRQLAEDLERYINQRLDFLEDGGTLIIRLTGSCPTGWEEDTSFRDLFMRGPDSTGGSVGLTGGTDSHTHDMTHGHAGTADAVGNHTHGISSDGTHDHNVSPIVQEVQSGVGSNAAWAISESNAGSHSHGGATGAGGTHGHTLSIGGHSGATGAGSNVPAYKRILVCKKVA